jgi:hypothetical protein
LEREAKHQLTTRPYDLVHPPVAQDDGDGAFAYQLCIEIAWLILDLQDQVLLDL